MTESKAPTPGLLPLRGHREDDLVRELVRRGWHLSTDKGRGYLVSHLIKGESG